MHVMMNWLVGSNWRTTYWRRMCRRWMPGTRTRSNTRRRCSRCRCSTSDRTATSRSSTSPFNIRTRSSSAFCCPRDIVSLPASVTKTWYPLQQLLTILWLWKYWSIHVLYWFCNSSDFFFSFSLVVGHLNYHLLRWIIQSEIDLVACLVGVFLDIYCMMDDVFKLLFIFYFFINWLLGCEWLWIDREICRRCSGRYRRICRWTWCGPRWKTWIVTKRNCITCSGWTATSCKWLYATAAPSMWCDTCSNKVLQSTIFCIKAWPPSPFHSITSSWEVLREFIDEIDDDDWLFLNVIECCYMMDWSI